jgi:hypothetical protein
MKTIGFNKEHDVDVIQEEFLSNRKEFNSILINEPEKQRIFDYLNNVERVFGITFALYDNENYIGSYMLFSDGEWIWTSHFAYYLKKLNFSIMTNEFLNHLRENEYKISPLSNEQKTYIDIFIHLKLLKTSEKDKEIIRQNAVKLGYNISKI